MHGKIENLYTSRGLNITVRVRIQTDHGLLPYLLPGVVRHNGELPLNNLSRDRRLILKASLHAQLSQILLETVLNLIYRRDSDVVGVDRLSHAELERFVRVVSG